MPVNKVLLDVTPCRICADIPHMSMELHKVEHILVLLLLIPCVDFHSVRIVLNHLFRGATSSIILTEMCARYMAKMR